MLSNRSFLRDERELVDMPGLGKGKKERKKEANIARQRVLSLTVADKLLLSRFDTTTYRDGFHRGIREYLAVDDD